MVFRILSALLVVVFIPPVETSWFSQRGAQLEFYQINLFYDNVYKPNSNWGTVKITYVGESFPLYFNLNVNGAWQVMNIPLLSVEGAGFLQSVNISYALPFPWGTDVNYMEYNFSITPYPLDYLPPGNEPANVQDLNQNMWSGGLHGFLPFAPPEPVRGFLVCDELKTHANFPNQEAGANECVPTAVSNSLQWLNTKHNLGMKAEDITTEKMKTATGWTKGGCDSNKWPDTKDAYMKAKGLPVKTTKYKPREIDKVYEQFADQDVEMDTGTHTVSVVGMAKLCNGDYTLVFAHDPDQNKPNTATQETVTWETTAAKIRGGGAWCNNKLIKNWIVECPNK
ncbi:MAG TPA: hypothetical protein VNK96_04665 [Fimbriimonadales bacterium]|nr:hypothetical protein [Fimbriimonadales bacterium]